MFMGQLYSVLLFNCFSEGHKKRFLKVLEYTFRTFLDQFGNNPDRTVLEQTKH